MRAKILPFLLIAGCSLGPKLPGGEVSESGASGSSGASAAEPGASEGVGSTGPTGSGGPGDEPATATAGIDTGAPDTSSGGGTTEGSGEPLACSKDLQDCPEGQKCNPFVPGGGPELYAGEFKCVSLDPAPKPVGAPCSVLGDPFDGTDDCELGAVCVDPDDQGVGECVEICTFDADLKNPHCDTPGQACVGLTCQDCTWNMCVTPCDPFDASTCDADEVCLHDWEVWVCVVDLSGDLGAPGDPCEYANTCDFGNICVDKSYVPGCEGPNCCAPACDTAAPDPCPGAAEGVVCQPWWPAGEAPEGQETLGVCMLPP